MSNDCSRMRAPTSLSIWPPSSPVSVGSSPGTRASPTASRAGAWTRQRLSRSLDSKPRRYSRWDYGRPSNGTNAAGPVSPTDESFQSAWRTLIRELSTWGLFTIPQAGIRALGPAIAMPGQELRPHEEPAMIDGFTVWFTGLPCSGKTTLAQLLVSRLRSLRYPVEVLDGAQVLMVPLCAPRDHHGRLWAPGRPPRLLGVGRCQSPEPGPGRPSGLAAGPHGAPGGGTQPRQ